MPRRPRIALPDVPMHIVQRGNNRCACFRSPQDYELYLERLAEISQAFGCAVHAYALMTNHVHLFLTPEGADSASLLMKHLGQWHTQYVNRTYARSGTLWEGRFRSCIALEEVYVLRCYRYIELNPVRAAMVRHPRDYRWSSYRFNSEGARSEFLVPHACYLGLGASAATRRTAYRELVNEALGKDELEEIRQTTNGNFALGTAAFRERIEAALGRRAGPGRPGRPNAGA